MLDKTTVPQGDAAQVLNAIGDRAVDDARAALLRMTDVSAMLGTVRVCSSRLDRIKQAEHIGRLSDVALACDLDPNAVTKAINKGQDDRLDEQADAQWEARSHTNGHGNGHDHAAEAKLAAAAAKAVAGALFTLEQWVTRDLPPADFLMGYWLTTTSRVLLTAPTGLGKTMFGLALGFAAAAGMPFLRWEGRRPCRVFVIDGEMARRLLKRRIVEEIERSGISPAGLIVLSYEDIEGFEPLNTKMGQAQIEAFITLMGGVDLIVFDNVMSLIGGDMRDEESWRQTLPWLKTLTKRNIGQVWIHHTGHDETRSYGTKTREWQMDTTIFLERVERLDTDVSFALTFDKARERTPETRADFADLQIALVDDVWTYSGATVTTKRNPSPTGQKFLEAFFNCVTVMHNGRGCVTNEAWRAECVRLGLIDRGAKPDVARALFSRHRRELVACNLVACDDDWSWRV
jgi:hypothetical protein